MASKQKRDPVEKNKIRKQEIEGSTDKLEGRVNGVFIPEAECSCFHGKRGGGGGGFPMHISYLQL